MMRPNQNKNYYGKGNKRVRKVNKDQDYKRRYMHEPLALRGAYIAAGIP
ncbi:unnamed protein product, partial [Brugia pahangi]|uniref:50S ribosomal protein L32e n=1 Tax=Brugia pahangi TaxID=6280 RepID=A0A0N4THZ5_BRUPA